VGIRFPGVACGRMISAPTVKSLYLVMAEGLCYNYSVMNTDFEKNYIEARRELIAKEFRRLNPMQREAVMATEGPLLILAGAGSGKTTVLINRIANLLRYGSASDSDCVPEGHGLRELELLRQGGAEGRSIAALSPCEPWRILAITFTNKAADQLKERLENMLGPQAGDIWACTFHSACVRILRRDASRLGFSDSFSIYDSADTLSLTKRILKDMELDEKKFPPKQLLSQISRIKDSMMGAEEFAKSAGAQDYYGRRLSQVYSEYSRRLFAANAMDFDDLICHTVRLLQNNEDVRSYWQRRFKYILVDEYQDTNHPQFLLCQLLSGGWGNLCVVGDDDQSIYKFRGATVENILSFERIFPGCRTIRLEQNYRSTGQILSAANAVIRNNRGRMGKELWTDKGRGDMVELYVADNEHEEAAHVANSILASFSRGNNWRDHAVLYRMNAQSQTLETAFKRSGIPYRIIGGTRFYDRAEIKDMLAYLCVIASNNDDLRLERIINVPARGIGLRSVELASQIARDEGLSLFEIIRRADEYSELSRAAVKMRLFADMIEELSHFAVEHDAAEVLRQVIEKTGYVRALYEKGGDEDISRAENVQELISSVISYMKDSGDESLEGYLANVALYTDMDNYDHGADSVVMMTIHSAKGLEFDNVYIVGMEDGIFPGMRSIGDNEEMEEERRLCYVALTRAKERLELVCAQQRMLFGRTSANRVSRFVEEIPEENIKKNIPRGYGYSQGRDHFGEGRETEMRRSSLRPTAQRQQTQAKPAQFAVGDSVRHRAFGPGVIVKLTPMGGDYLVEINFAGQGTKRLMLRAAAMQMEKE